MQNEGREIIVYLKGARYFIDQLIKYRQNLAQ